MGDKDSRVREYQETYRKVEARLRMVIQRTGDGRQSCGISRKKELLLDSTHIWQTLRSL